jgi:ketol-acid reductoisomerase
MTSWGRLSIKDNSNARLLRCGADMNRIKSKTAAIIGFGPQGHAHALYPCNSGVRKVVVGLRPSSVGVAKAEAASLEVVDAAEAP